MPTIPIEVDADALFAAGGNFGILGPTPEEPKGAWVVYVPRELPCICNSFESAAAVLRKALQQPRVRKR